MLLHNRVINEATYVLIFFKEKERKEPIFADAPFSWKLAQQVNLNTTRQSCGKIQASSHQARFPRGKPECIGEEKTKADFFPLSDPRRRRPKDSRRVHTPFCRPLETGIPRRAEGCARARVPSSETRRANVG